MSDNIPLEIQAEILKRLPLKPLIQFRSVSKPWKSLIDSPGFIVSYSVRHPQPDDRFILRYKPSSHYPVEDRYLTLVDNDDDGFVQQDFVPTIPDLVKKFEPRLLLRTDISMRVVGSSHGLMCFNGYYECPHGHSSNRLRTVMFVIWNPSIRKSVGIQSMILPPTKNCGISISGSTVIGFGVCPATLDPTILKINCFYYKRIKKYMAWKVGVFTLSTGTWSILSTNLPRASVRLEGSQVVIDRFIFWVAFDSLGAGFGGSKSNSLIVSFDLTTKEFKEINLTDSLTNQLCRIQSISKLRESLVVLAYHGSVGEDFVSSLWMMMKEQGVNRSFTKLYNINVPNPIINRILGFRKTCELIIETQRQNAELEIYDPISNAIDNLGISGDGYSFFMCSYMETLLLLDQLDGFTYLSSD